MITMASIKQFQSDRDYMLYASTIAFKEDKEGFVESKRKLIEESKIKNKPLLEKINNAESVLEKFKKMGGE